MLRRARLAAALCLLATPAYGGSALRVPLPERFGVIEAATYDTQGNPVGPATIRVERLRDGQVRLDGSSAIAGAEQTRVMALLEPTPDGTALRPLRQESRSFDAAGAPLGVLTVDHGAGVATCARPDAAPDEVEAVELPAGERVANVVLAHLLRPLAGRGSGALDFDVFICRPSVRVIGAAARVVSDPGADGIVEIQTGLRLGPILSRLLGPWLPKVSLWFDRSTPAWLGHRMPLFAKGPTVLVLRAGVAPELIAP